MGRTSDARERLIDAMIDLVWSASYGTVGVDAICERAGVKKGSFYHFFQSKDDLVVAALDAHWESRKPHFDAMFSVTLPPVERLRRYLGNVRERQVEVRAKYGRVLGCFHNNVGASCIEQPAEITAKVQEVIGNLVRYLVSTFRDAQAEGSMPKGDPEKDADVLFAYVQGTLLQARIHDDPELLRDLPVRGLALLGISGQHGASPQTPPPRSKTPPRGARPRPLASR